MSADIFHHPAAQRPFYRWLVDVSRAGQTIGRFVAKIGQTQDDPLADETVAADRIRIDVAIPLSGDGGWNDPSHPPRPGDRLSIVAGPLYLALEFAVTSAKAQNSSIYFLEARQC